jgi:hypothetical protein
MFKLGWLFLWLVSEVVVVIDVLSRFLDTPFICSEAHRCQQVMTSQLDPTHYHVVVFHSSSGLYSQSLSSHCLPK